LTPARPRLVTARRAAATTPSRPSSSGSTEATPIRRPAELAASAATASLETRTVGVLRATTTARAMPAPSSSVTNADTSHARVKWSGSAEPTRRFIHRTVSNSGVPGSAPKKRCRNDGRHRMSMTG
jgi:hypothetical protein